MTLKMTLKEMSCHTWAISGNLATAKTTHQSFEKLTHTLGFPYLTEQKPLPQTHDGIINLRKSHMQELVKLCDERTEYKHHKVYFCAGFSSNPIDTCPEHFWLEDHTDKRTYDTFVRRELVVTDEVGKPGRSFKPGCEATAFPADQIIRIPLDGFTRSQVDSMQNKPMGGLSRPVQTTPPPVPPRPSTSASASKPRPPAVNARLSVAELVRRMEHRF